MSDIFIGETSEQWSERELRERISILDKKLAAAKAEVEGLKAEVLSVRARHHEWANQAQSLLTDEGNRADEAEHKNQALEAANRELREKLFALCLAIDEYDRLTAPSRLVECKELLERLK